MLPDVVQDNITDCAQRLGFIFVEQVFFQASLQAGYGLIAEQKTQELNMLWCKKGYDALPDFVKDYVLAVTNGERR